MDTLQHLSHINGGNRHPNVLAFVDSWEEDESLFIRTELCELGNLARFLWEFGRAFPRLDEARVWKIIVDLSNVSSMRYSASAFKPHAITHAITNRAFGSSTTLE